MLLNEINIKTAKWQQKDIFLDELITHLLKLFLHL